jgi:hypothetical protein
MSLMRASFCLCQVLTDVTQLKVGKNTRRSVRAASLQELSSFAQRRHELQTGPSEPGSGCAQGAAPSAYSPAPAASPEAPHHGTAPAGVASRPAKGAYVLTLNWAFARVWSCIVQHKVRSPGSTGC